MSRKSECYAEISRCNEQIERDRQEIARLQQEISELETARKHTLNVKDQLTSCESKSYSELNSPGQAKKTNERIQTSYFDTMSVLLERTSYPSIKKGLANAYEDLGDEIKRREERIRNLNADIASCNSTISAMYAEIAEIEAEEERERERERESSSASSGPGVVTVTSYSSGGPGCAR